MVDKGNYSIYVPQNATGPTDVVIYYGGAWTGTDGYVYKEYVKSNPNKIVILADKVVAPTSELYNGLQDTLTSNGLTAGNIDILAHSMGDKYAVNSAIDAPNYGFHVNT